jgi:hypothetical protein
MYSYWGAEIGRLRTGDALQRSAGGAERNGLRAGRGRRQRQGNCSGKYGAEKALFTLAESQAEKGEPTSNDEGHPAYPFRH